MTSFLRWGCTADFDHPYVTMEPAYVARQLELFADLFDKGLIRRALQPVYWSPSSRTALAESELEYNPEHCSTAVYFRFLVINLDTQKVRWFSEKPPGTEKKTRRIYALIWTTTPWTIPLNNAIALNENTEYAFIEFPEQTKKDSFTNIYIVAKNMVQQVADKLGLEVCVHGFAEGRQLGQGDIYYRNAMYDDFALPILSANFVRSDSGTGLVHLAYAHGHDDFQVGNSQSDFIECFVDEQGRFTRHMGHQLEGKEVMGEGSRTVLEMFRKHVLHCEEHIHSYPYDWRTHKPVIIRSCPQWFVDVSQLNSKCLELVEGGDEQQSAIHISSGQTDLHTAFAPTFRSRTHWCISRQRVWGVPIPGMRDKETGDVITSPQFIRSYAKLVREKCDTDLWWTLSTQDISKLEGFPQIVNTSLDKFEKCAEVMDVWMDSGLAWHTLPPASESADVVVEGSDQFRGWFQSSLLTSLALRDKVPFKRIIVHGLAVDGQGKKMSKSRGNVVLPESITDGSLYTEPIGADGLRLWVAWLASETSGNVSIGPTVIEDLKLRLKQIRLIFRFILGSLESARDCGVDFRFWPSSTVQQSSVEIIPLRTLDRFMLASMDDLSENATALFANYRFAAFVDNYHQFLQVVVSSRYFNSVRDRLYCDPVKSASHNAALWTLDLLGRELAATIAPILPHLAVEFFTHHPTLRDDPAKAFREAFEPKRTLKHKEVQRAIGDRVELGKLMALVQQLRELLTEKIRTVRPEKVGVRVHAGEQQLALLRSIHPPSDRLYSDLVELLGTSFVCLGEPASELAVEVLNPREEGLDPCPRCRKVKNDRRKRMEQEEADIDRSKLCQRCEHAERLSARNNLQQKDGKPQQREEVDEAG